MSASVWLGDMKGHWLIPGSQGWRRGTSKGKQKGAVPLSCISRVSAFLGSLGIMKNKSRDIKKKPQPTNQSSKRRKLSKPSAAHHYRERRAFPTPYSTAASPTTTLSTTDQ